MIKKTVSPLLWEVWFAALQVREGLKPSGDRLRETLSVHTGELVSRALLYWAEDHLSLLEEQETTH